MSLKHITTLTVSFATLRRRLSELRAVFHVRLRNRCPELFYDRQATDYSAPELGIFNLIEAVLDHGDESVLARAELQAFQQYLASNQVDAEQFKRVCIELNWSIKQVLGDADPQCYRAWDDFTRWCNQAVYPHYQQHIADEYEANHTSLAAG